MFNCSVKITDRLGRLEDLNAVDLEQPLKQRSINENSITKEPELVRMSSSTKLMSSIRHKISNASHFMQVCTFSLFKLLTPVSPLVLNSRSKQIRSRGGGTGPHF